jgi:lipid A 3-O-deacylase
MRARGFTFLTLALLWAVPLAAEEPQSLAFSGGVSNFNKSEKRVELGFEYRHPIQVWGMAVAAGLTVNDDKSVWVFGGLRRDFSLSGSWIITPAFAITLYEQGDGKDLGGTLEFRSALEIGYEWQSRRRLAFVIYHLSNAGIYDHNPGMNSLILTYSFPI